MKKKILILAAVLPAIIADSPLSLQAGTAKPSENLLKYGGFECLKAYASPFVDFNQAKPFYGWDCVGDWFEHIQVGREAVEGNACVVITSPCWICRGAKVEPGKEYRITGHMRTALREMTNKSGLGAYFEVKAGKKILLRRTLSGTRPWTQLTGLFTVPPDVRNVKINIGVKNTVGTAWFDGFEITRLEKNK